MLVKITPRKDNAKTIRSIERRGSKFGQGLIAQMRGALKILEAAILINVRKGGPRNLRVGTGALINAISNSSEVTQSGSSVFGFIGPVGIPYARIHEQGGKVRAKRSNYLWIPLKENRSPSGLARMSPSDLVGRDEFAMIPVFTGKGGFLAGLRADADPDQFQPLFKLQKEVDMPARPYLRPALKSTRTRIREKFGLFLKSTFIDGDG